MNRRVNVLGVGMIRFAKPGASDEYDVMGANAARAALEDAGIAYDEVEQAYTGYVFGESTCGQAAMYRVGLTGIPVYNVNNNCSTGSTALMLARQAIEGLRRWKKGRSAPSTVIDPTLSCGTCRS
jgi:acetyl-CoA acetyltransferase